MVINLDKKSVLLISMPFADITIPSIQLSLLESYLKNNDVNVTSLHLYVFAAETYGLKNYSFLINPPNDPYATQMVFSKYVFPTHWKKNKGSFKEYYDSTITCDSDIRELLSFEEFENKTDLFLNGIIEGVKWDDFDIIGFSLNYGQFLPSLSIAKQLKHKYPEKTIVFGGSTTMNELGKQIIQLFDYIDYIISGDGEKGLLQLAQNTNSTENIPGLISRNNSKKAIYNTQEYVDLDSRPFLDFTSFYQQVQMSSPEIQQYIQLNSRLPIELSRGCWWNKCSFCNQKAYHPVYREKSADRFVEELSYLSETYKNLSFQVIGSALPHKNLRPLCEKIINLKKDFSFIAETRADHLKSEDYHFLKKAGFDIIQTGIETFSTKLIKKMDKGSRVIDNIAALKFCKEHGIKNEYNLIINFPNEEEDEFNETLEIISLFKQYLNPPRTSSFVVGYNSPVYNNLKKYNIQRLTPKKTDKIMFPNHILKNNFQFFYDYIPKQELPKNDWNTLISSWKDIREHVEQVALNTKKLTDQLIFYYLDGGKFIKIFDKRNLVDVQIYVLNENERRVFLSCEDITTFKEINHKLSNLPEQNIKDILEELIKNNILYQENDSFISLPLNASKCLGKSFEKQTEIIKQENLLVQ